MRNFKLEIQNGKGKYENGRTEEAARAAVFGKVSWGFGYAGWWLGD